MKTIKGYLIYIVVAIAGIIVSEFLRCADKLYDEYKDDYE